MRENTAGRVREALEPSGCPAVWRVLRAWRVLDAGERPVRVQPVTYGAPKWRVQVRVALSHPRECAGVVIAVRQRVDVDAPDHVAAGGIEHRVREPLPAAEVVGVALQVCAV